MNAISRLLPRLSHFRLLLSSAASKPLPSSTSPLLGASSSFLRHLSTGGGGLGDDDVWKLNQESGATFDPFVGFSGEDEHRAREPWPGGEGDSSWESPGFATWSLDEDKKGDEDVFGFGEGELADGIEEVDDVKRREEMEALEHEEKALISVLKGPNRAFGDLIAASGITDAMLDSLIALKDFEGVQGLPPLSEIEEERYEKSTRRSVRAEMERLKQEEAAKARVRKVDEQGRAYGTGRRKCSIARVWIQPGEGKFVINDKEFDVYFPMLDHRAALLQPFTETKTLGLWDVKCHVLGGGVSGQVGAIQLGVSRALQNWEPDLRPPLRSGGFLTRDSRVVERKKPGKAKARKSFQWVKR